MEKKLSLSTINICIASIENLKQKIEESIRYHEEHDTRVPTWMMDIRNDYENAITELENL